MLRPYKSAEVAQIRRMVKAAAFALQPDLVSLRHELGEDYEGSPCIKFFLVISDTICYSVPHNNELNFARIEHLKTAIRNIVEPWEYGVVEDFTIRSEREQRERHDKRFQEAA